MVLHNPNNWHWVDKKVLPWAKEWVEENITKISADEGDVSVKISKVVSMDGDVDVCQRKNKVITYYDVKLVLEYTGSAPDAPETSGTITIPEVAHDTEENEFVFDIDIYSEAKEKQPVKNLIRSKITPQLRTELPKLTPALIAAHGKDIQHDSNANPSSGFKPASTYPAKTDVASKASGSSAQTKSNTAVGPTSTINDSREFRAEAKSLYEHLTRQLEPEAFKDAKVGSKFEFSSLSGQFEELSESKIARTVRFKGWPEGHYSKQVIEFNQSGANATIRINWSDIPKEELAMAQNYWENAIARRLGMSSGDILLC